ncbi:MAG: radical SAM protein [Chitinispirillaceae bacterium]|nr:radical SAM protein [Chitinispirillaceae bacterium]
MGRPASYTVVPAEQWEETIRRLDQIARSCELCPRRCGVDRFSGETGFCGAPGELIVSSIFPHHGEEPPISGAGGSGTVFFTFCTLQCVFCQNYQLSHLAEGRPYTVPELAEKMRGLQEAGCHNINLVTATHFLPWVVRALKQAAESGLTIPIVYNCGGYELAETLALLSGIVDIYLPDMKYGNNESAAAYSGAGDYVEVNRRAVSEMFRQTGPLRLDESGIAYRGMCIRHLVLPENRAGTAEILRFLPACFDPHDLYISLMAQYRPLHRAVDFPEINRSLTAGEYEPFKRECIEQGLNGFYQELERIDRGFVIDFNKRKEERLTGND